MAGPRLLVIIGSGETGPQMARLHQTLLHRVGGGSVVVVDTPYAFQENATELDGKLGDYFERNVGHPAEVVAVRNDGDAGRTASALDRVRQAALVFAGPGSPSYALHHWLATRLPGALARKLATGGVVSFASAAAATAGRWALPVYEIYKAGADPHWLDGLDLTAVAGVSAVVVPHWNNAEGGTHDTSRCYVGDRRLTLLERRLPPGTVVFGVDEHTAAIVDLDADAVEGYGKGVVTFRRHGREITIGPGEQLGLDDVRKLVVGPAPLEVQPVGAAADGVAADGVAEPLTELEHALAAGSAGDAAAVALDLAGDDDEALAAVVARLAGAASEARADPIEAALPHVEAVLAARAAARAAGDFALADGVRDFLAALGIELHDTPSGTTWERTAELG